MVSLFLFAAVVKIFYLWNLDFNLSAKSGRCACVYSRRLVRRCTLATESIPIVYYYLYSQNRLRQVVRKLRTCFSLLCMCIWDCSQVGLLKGPRPKFYHYCRAFPSLGTASVNFARRALTAAWMVVLSVICCHVVVYFVWRTAACCCCVLFILVWPK